MNMKGYKGFKGHFFVSDKGNIDAVVEALNNAYIYVMGLEPRYIATGGKMHTNDDGSRRPVYNKDSGWISDAEGTQLAVVHEPGNVPRTTATGSVIENPRLVEIFATGSLDAKLIMTFIERTMLEKGFEIGMNPSEYLYTIGDA